MYTTPSKTKDGASAKKSPADDKENEFLRSMSGSEQVTAHAPYFLTKKTP
ncbi:MAG: hypothetical protein WC878_03705 [Candidatus Paceibacterota bacterium]|jgi:endonuclease IV